MNRYEWTELSLKIFSLFLLFKFLSAVPSVINMLVMAEKYDGKWAMPGAIAGVLVSLVLALILWRLAPAISKAIWRKADTSKTIPNPDIDEIQAALFSTIGLFVLVNTLPHISQYLILINQTSSPFQSESALEFKAKVELTTLLVQFAIGIFLLLSSKGLVNLVKMIRNLGLKKQD
jgi:hypothetical protein